MAHGILNIAWCVDEPDKKNKNKKRDQNVTRIENLQCPMAIIRFTRLTSIWVRCFECGEKTC